MSRENGRVEDADARPEPEPLTAEEARRGLFPETLDDLRFRARAFAIVAAADAEHRRKQARRSKPASRGR